MTNSIDPGLRMKRLRYRSWHRGCKETDLVLGQFSDSGLADLPVEMLDLYEQFLEENDADIWDWLTGKCVPPIAAYEPILVILKDYGLAST